MEPATATAVCERNFKSKNIMVHGNATIILQTGPKLVCSVEQRKALELMAIVEEKCPIAATRLAIKASHLSSKKVLLKDVRKSP